MLSTRRSLRHALTFRLTVCLTMAVSAALGSAQTTSDSMITGAIDDSVLVTLTGNTHPLALPKYDLGIVPDSLPMQHMYLELRRSPAQEKALSTVLTAMQTPNSPSYHKWLSAEELGKNYGPAAEDIGQIEDWLSGHGLQVNGVSKSGLTLDVSGNAAQVRDAFHTEIHTYAIKGQQYIANASDPRIPAALSSLVAGFNSLNSFFPKPAFKKVSPNLSYNNANGEQYDEGPADFATIYNATPLYTAKEPITGKGQTVVVLEDTDVDSSDVKTFRYRFGLSTYAGTFSQIHPGAGCGNPGRNAAEVEAAVDAEWAGSAAPDTAVELASCADTATTFGAFIAAQNLLDLATPPPIMSLSYSECEAHLGPSGNAFVNQLWKQAALEGVSVFVSAGDNGPAGCDDPDTATYAIDGIQANGLASTPYDTATGGTDFLDFYERSYPNYWNSFGNGPGGKSARSYVPEMTWDDSCASGIVDDYYGNSPSAEWCTVMFYDNVTEYMNITAGSGAPSFVYAKPDWQNNVYGNPADSVRDLPDVSLFAGNGLWNHAVLFCMSDAAQGGYPCNYENSTDIAHNSGGGTSFTAPQLASIQALINQKTGAPQGNAAPLYYQLGEAEYGTAISPHLSETSNCDSSRGPQDTASCVLHDVTRGSNQVPCYGTVDCYIQPTIGVLSTSDSQPYVAYSAGAGWDFTTGLGSVNVTNVVNNWP